MANWINDEHVESDNVNNNTSIEKEGKNCS